MHIFEERCYTWFQYKWQQNLSYEAPIDSQINCDFWLDFFITYYSFIYICWNARDEFWFLYFGSRELTTIKMIFWTLNTLRESSLILFLNKTFHSIFMDPWTVDQRSVLRRQKKQRYLKSSDTINYIFSVYRWKAAYYWCTKWFSDWRDLFLSGTDTSEKKRIKCKKQTIKHQCLKHKGTDIAQPFIRNHFSMAVQNIRLSLHRTKLNKLIKFKSSGGVSNSWIAHIHSTSILAYAQDQFIAIL